MLIYKVGPQWGRWGASMRLMHWTAEKDPRQGSPLNAWMGGAAEKEALVPKRPSECQLQESWKKDSDGAITPATEAVSVPAHLEHPGVPKAKQLCHLHTQLSLGAELPEAKKVSCLGTQGRFGHIQLFATLYTVACQASLSRVYFRQEYWNVLGNSSCHVLLEHYISCSLAANSPEYLVLPEPLPPKQRHHRHTWPSQGQTKSSRAASGANPSGWPTCRGGNKTAIETQGQCD